MENEYIFHLTFSSYLDFCVSDESKCQMSLNAIFDRPSTHLQKSYKPQTHYYKCQKHSPINIAHDYNY